MRASRLGISVEGAAVAANQAAVVANEAFVDACKAAVAACKAVAAVAVDRVHTAGMAVELAPNICTQVDEITCGRLG